MQRSQLIIMVTIMTMAIILATSSFLAYTYIQGRYDGSGDNAAVVTIEGVAITLLGDPDQMVLILPDGLAGTDQTVALAPTTAPEDTSPTEATAVPATPIPTAVPPPPTPVPVPVIFITHTVQSGDSLYGLTLQFATSIALMARYNIDAAELNPGKQISLPIGNPAYCPGARPYAVGEGDTVFNLSHRFNTTPDEIKARNGLSDDYLIKVAEIICLPQP